MTENGWAAGDLAEIAGIAAEVAGVKDAAAVLDRRLRTVRTAEDERPRMLAPGTPIPQTRPALVSGPPPVSGPCATVTEALLRAAEVAPDRGTTYVSSDGGTDRQTYPELLDDALRALSGLRGLGLRPGDGVLLQCADSRTFVTAFWACVLGGYVPTAVGPAPEYHTDNAVVRKLRAAWDLLDGPPIVTDDALRGPVTALAARWGAEGRLRAVALSELSASTPAEPYEATPDDPFVNLLTSGSTGTPKCVQHPHRTITARTYAAIAANGFTEDEVSFNWMPLDHVGGMVMFNVRDTFLACEHVNARPESVIRRPLNWLDWAERFGATNTWAPNFAFALVNKHAEEIAAGRWDLSRLRNICNAGEAVVARTAFRFLELLVPHGLPADAMVPCWGMSETSSGVTYSRMDAADRTVGTVSLASASLDGDLAVTEHGAPGSVLLTEVGEPVAGVSLRIVDEEGRVLPEGRVGRLHISGSTIMNGYRRNDRANAESFTDDGWFDTGDLGFLREGRLTLTGRRKHMVIVNGANYPAHEIETVIEQVPGVRAACSAVCAVPDEETGTDAVVAFFVPAQGAEGRAVETVAEIHDVLARDLALRPQSVIPLTEAEFPRQAGGKVQRERLVEALREGRFADRLHGAADRAASPERGGGDALLEPVWRRTESAPVQDARPVVLYAPAGTRMSGTAGTITPGPVFRAAEGRVEADLLDPAQQERALAHLGVRGAGAEIVYAVETGPEVPGAPERLLVTLAALAAAAPDADLTVLTQGAAAVDRDDVLLPSRAALTGLVRTAAAEGLLGGVRLVDIPWDADPAESVGLRHGLPDEVAAVRDGTVLVRRLRIVEPSDGFAVPEEFLPSGGTALLVGGLGGLGRTVAEHLLVAEGARLLIVGRTPPDRLSPAARTVLEELGGLGEVRYRAVDVGDAAALAAAVAAAEHDWGSTLDLVVQLAGEPVAPQWKDLAAHGLARETLPWLRAMLRPKLDGGASLDALLGDRPGTAAVVFSSVNGFLGGSGFGAYAAANAAADAYAHRWAARGHATRCIAWSNWAGPGMNEGSPLVAAARHRGLQLIEPAEGLAMLLSALNQPRPYLIAGADPANPHLKASLAADQFTGSGVVVGVVPSPDADPERVRGDVAAALAERGVFARVATMAQIPRDAAGAADPVAVLAARDRRAGPRALPRGPVEEALAGVLEAVLGLEEIGRDDSFFSLGCDSIRAVQVAGGLSERFGREVAVGLLYEYPTVRELAEAIGPA